jgi:hypothetical protein
LSPNIAGQVSLNGILICTISKITILFLCAL